MLERTGVMCLVFVGTKAVDLGNYYIDSDGNRAIIISAEDCTRYAHLVHDGINIYVRKDRQ